MTARYSSAARTVAPHDPPPERSTLFGWIGVLIWAAVIFTMSTSHFGAVNTGRVITAILGAIAPWASPASVAIAAALTRKVAHFFEYAVLYWLLARGPCARRPWLALLICLVYACTDEFHQSFVPDRTASILDVGIDFSGALFSRFLHLALIESRSRPDAMAA